MASELPSPHDIAVSEPAHRSPARSPIFCLLVLLSLLAIGAGFWQLQRMGQFGASQASPAAIDVRLAPDFRLARVNGGLASLSDYRGQVVLLNFWATWCPPCKAEMPDLDALHREYGPAHSFTVVGVDVEEGQAAVEAFQKQYDLSFPLLLDGQGNVSNGPYAVRNLPTSMIIDREGKIRDMWIGQISKSAMISRLQRVW